MKIVLKNPLATRRLAASLAAVCAPGTVIYLQGDLGAGKTTFVRGFLRGLGYNKHVRSPTFNLYELYQIQDFQVCHFDLYRLADPRELEYIGITDFFTTDSICLIEWPDHGKGFLQQADLVLKLDFVKEGGYREVEIIPNTYKAKEMVLKINDKKLS